MDFVKADDNDAIANEISIDELHDSSVDMISHAQDVNVLLPQYKDAVLPGFLTGIIYLSKKYRMLRRVRGDGNCFYRSCFFGYLENMLSKYKGTNDKNKEDAINEKKRILNIITVSKQELIDYGYSEIAIESFYDIVIEILDNLFTYTQNDLLNSFQASGLSDYYTWYMRLLTSLGMKKNVDRYLPFIDDADMNAYCLREVEPMGKEVEAMMIQAMTEYLGIKLKIEYLDGKPFEKELSCVLFNAETETEAETEFDVVLLYRPGHYDILYT